MNRVLTSVSILTLATASACGGSTPASASADAGPEASVTTDGASLDTSVRSDGGVHLDGAAAPDAARDAELRPIDAADASPRRDGARGCNDVSNTAMRLAYTMSANPVPTWVGGSIPNGRYHCVERNYYGGTAPSGMFQETLEITGDRIEQSIAIEQGVLMLMQTSTMMYTTNLTAFSIRFACGGSAVPTYVGYSVVTRDGGASRLMFGVRSGEATLVSTYELQ